MKWLISLAAYLALSSIVSAEMREWTAGASGATFEAKASKIAKGMVTLEDADGNALQVPIAQLSEADRTYLKAWYRNGGKAVGKNGAGRKGTSKKPSPDAKKEPKKKDNFNDPWPVYPGVEGEVPIAIAMEDAENKKYVYHSPHYEFTADVRLGKSLVSRLARMFEATFITMQKLPLNFEKATKFKEGVRFPILLFETKADYIKNGGPPTSAGVFMGGSNTVMVPLTSLGVRTLGSKYIIDRDASNRTLVHELVHQLTDRAYYATGARGWFTEGLAEYVANSPYSSAGRIKIRGNSDEITDYATAGSKKYGYGRWIGTDLKVPDLREYMLMPYGQFTGESAAFNYGFGSLIVMWLFNEDAAEDRTHLTAFMKAMKAGKKGDELLKVIRNGRSWEEFCEALAKGLRREGVKVEFGEVKEPGY